MPHLHAAHRRMSLVDPVKAPSTRGALQIVVNDLPHEEEQEPNNQTSEAQELDWPVTIDGRIERPGDEDRFRFEAKKNEKIEFRLRSATLGLPLDGFLRIEDMNGKQVARDDDAGEASDPLLNWKFQSNGTYILVVGDLYGHGGPEFAYALDVQTPQPDFKATIDTSAIRIEPGKTNELKVAIARSNGHTNELGLTFTGLPEGVTAENSSVGTKDKEAKVRLVADTDAKPSNGPFRIMVDDKVATNSSHAVQFELRPKESRFGEMLISFTDQLWLTVSTNAPAEKPKSK